MEPYLSHMTSGRQEFCEETEQFSETKVHITEVLQVEKKIIHFYFFLLDLLILNRFSPKEKQGIHSTLEVFT